MKTLSLVIFLLASSHAKADCIKNMEDTLEVITHPSYMMLAINPIVGFTATHAATVARDAIDENLDLYENMIDAIRWNLAHGVSNKAIYDLIEQKLAARETEEFYGIKIGHKIISCIRPRLLFKGTPSQQLEVAHNAMLEIDKIRTLIHH